VLAIRPSCPEEKIVRTRLTSMVCMQGWQAPQRGTELKPPPGARAGSVSTTPACLVSRAVASSLCVVDSGLMLLNANLMIR
jgi:hypothetical protein